MAHHTDGALVQLSRPLQIEDGRLLSGNRGLPGHIEVFLPAHKCAVRPPEPDAQGAVRHVVTGGGELQFLLLIRQGDEMVHADGAEAMGVRHGQKLSLPSVKIRHNRFLHQLHPFRLRKRPAPRIVDALEVQIAEIGHNQGIDRIPGRKIKPDVSSPGKIIHDIGHVFSSLSSGLRRRIQHSSPTNL